MTCEVHVNTGEVFLRFPARADDAGARDFWRREEAAWLATFDGWKCRSACSE